LDQLLETNSSAPFNTPLHVNTKEDTTSKSFVESKKKILAILSSSLVNLPALPHIIIEQLKSQTVVEKAEHSDNENEDLKSSTGKKKQTQKKNNVFKKLKRKRDVSCDYVEKENYENDEKLNDSVILDVELSSLSSISQTFSTRKSTQKRDNDFIYESDISSSEKSETEEEELVMLGNDEETESSIENEYVSEKLNKKFGSLNSIGNSSVKYPSVYECQHILTGKVIPCFLQNSYFAQLIETVLGGRNLIYWHQVCEGEDKKKRILEALLLLPIHEILPNAFEYLAKEMFMLDEIELRKACECYKKWITSEETELPFYTEFTEACDYWEKLENDNTGWQYISKLALIFLNTLPSESSVERDFSRGKYGIGDRRFNCSRESMDAELILYKTNN
jgi:hypothetical protein